MTDRADEKVPENTHSASVSAGQSIDMNLEEILLQANRIGIEFADKRKEAEHCELLRTPLRAKIMNRLETECPGASESRLKRLAEADEEYIFFLKKIAELRAEAEKLKIRYESYRSLFEAKRTLISYKKVELMSLG